MKRIAFLFCLCLTCFSLAAQKYTEDDVKQFYRTLEGDYTAQLYDSVPLSLHLTPIWGESCRWLYLEAVNEETNTLLEQKILEVKPISDITFKVIVHEIKDPSRFVGKWGNRNFFDGFNTSILKGKSKYVFMKTRDFEYQTDWNGRKSFQYFQKGDRIHFKCSQEDERIYVKRLLAKTSNIKGIIFFKVQTD